MCDLTQDYHYTTILSRPSYKKVRLKAPSQTNPGGLPAEMDRLQVKFTPTVKKTNGSMAVGQTGSLSVHHHLEKKPQPIIGSPYESRMRKFANAKLLSNRVYVPWYRRYVNTLPDSQLDFQPFQEIQTRDEDIALQHYYGKDYRQFENLNDVHSLMERAMALRRYNKMKQILMERERAIPESVMNDRSESKRESRLKSEDMFGFSQKERGQLIPVLDFLRKQHLRRNRLAQGAVNLRNTSKWHVLRKPTIQAKMAKLHEELLRHEIRMRFIRAIAIVRSVLRFLNAIRVIARDTKLIYEEVLNFQARQQKEDAKFSKYTNKDSDRIYFHLDKYNLHEKENIPAGVKMSLTKPWFNRSEDEITAIVESLQILRSFVAYPDHFQQRLAKAAWFQEVPKDRVVIRQCHNGMNMYFILSGKARVVKLVGSPVYNRPSKFEVIRYVRKYDTFGEECIANPDMLRSYSVITESKCQLLSVNLTDFFEVMMATHHQETAPGHIRFLGHMAFLDSFPKPVLLSEAQGNIYIFHFPSGTLIAKDLDKSEYVYVITYGTASVLIELPPHPFVMEQCKNHLLLPSISSKFERRLRRSVSDIPATVQKVIRPSENHDKPISSIFRKPSVSSRSQRNSVSDTPATVQKDLIPELISKHTFAEAFMKEVCRRSNAFLGKNIDTLGAMRILNHSLADTTSTISLYVKARLQVERNSIARGRHKRADDIEEEQEEELLRRGKHQTTGIITDVNSSESVNATLSERSVTFLVDTHPSETRVRKGTSTHIVGTNMEFEKAGAPIVFPRISPQRMKAADTRTQALPTSESETSKDSSDSGVSYSNVGKTKCQHSRWKLKRTLIKGDCVGTEFLDYNDGPFTPPKDIWSLVSNGATIIQVRKTLLLSHLRKVW